MNRFKRFLPILTAALFSPAAMAQNIAGPSSAFASVEKTDWARAWIEYLFHGSALPDGMASFALPFTAAADGMRQALGLYSFGMLMVGALLVFYHIAGMVAETAHHGVVFGRRVNQVWMPIRFVLAIGLLVPVSGSLNAGQYLVLKIAEEGSALASNAWREVASVGGDRLSGLVSPRGPDVAKLVATAVEMETCRLVYQQTYATLQDDYLIRMAGNIGALMTKIPANRYSSETWRVSNILNVGAPLCGEVRFSGFRRPILLNPAESDAIGLVASHLSGFAHEQADDLFARARMVATRAAPVFLNTTVPVGADIQNDLATLEGMYRSKLEAEKQGLVTAGPQIAASALQASVDAGWLAAARFILELVRLQESTSSLFDHALPTPQEPVIAHPPIARQLLIEALDTMPNYRPLDQEGFAKLATFYGQVARVMSQLHGWIYSSQIPEKDPVPPSSFDLRDRLNAGTDPLAAFSLYAQALDAAALERGVWGLNVESGDAGYPFTPLASNVPYNPFAAVVEFGHRQIDLASELAGWAGSGISSAGTAGPAALLGILALLFMLGGLTLVFVAPLLPFARFLMGALAWAINLFEAVVAMPIVALAHLSPTGEGLSGALARQAYMLWLGLFVRPLLTLLGFVLGFLLFALSLAFLNVTLMSFAQLASPSNDGLLTIANTGLVLLYDVLIYVAVNACFKSIHWLPDNALRWLSRFVTTDGGNMPVPVNAGGTGGGGAAAFFSGPSGSGSSATSTAVGYGMGSAKSSSGGVSPEAQSHAAKTALFPTYADKSEASGPVSPAGTSVSVSSTSMAQGGSSRSMGNDLRKPVKPTRTELDPGIRRKDREEPKPDTKPDTKNDGDDKPK